MKTAHIFALIICLAIPLAIGGISGIATTQSSSSWFTELVKPSFYPPSWVFGPAWTVLYILMGISMFLIWKTDPGSVRTTALLLTALQLLLNFAWSFLFFWFKSPGWALADIILLLSALSLMTVVYFRVNTMAALMQIPYILWVCFATALNAAIWLKN